ncbi:MAG: hypothetical protein DMG11_15645 [Acidobacteria bacterium]|nr:MAG: hypothetical protein DMG11_15645 [Acidobacteriota bacterium]
MKAMKALTRAEAIAIPAGVQALDGQSSLETTGGDYDDTGLGLAAVLAGGLAAAGGLLLWASI